MPNRPTSPNACLPFVPHYGINRRELDRVLLQLGGQATHLRRTGEIAYSHPALVERPRADGRRKDAPLHLVRFVRRIFEMTSPTIVRLPAASAWLGVQS